MSDLSALVCKMKDGRVIPVAAGESVSPLLNLAREIRISGLHDGSAVQQGCVWNQSGVVKTFRCGTPSTILEAKAPGMFGRRKKKE